MFEYYSKEDLEKALEKLYARADALGNEMISVQSIIRQVRKQLKEKNDN